MQRKLNMGKGWEHTLRFLEACENSNPELHEPASRKRSMIGATVSGMMPMFEFDSDPKQDAPDEQYAAWGKRYAGVAAAVRSAPKVLVSAETMRLADILLPELSTSDEEFRLPICPVVMAFSMPKEGSTYESGDHVVLYIWEDTKNHGGEQTRCYVISPFYFFEKHNEEQRRVLAPSYSEIIVPIGCRMCDVFDGDAIVNTSHRGKPTVMMKGLSMMVVNMLMMAVMTINCPDANKTTVRGRPPRMRHRTSKSPKALPEYEHYVVDLKRLLPAGHGGESLSDDGLAHRRLHPVRGYWRQYISRAKGARVWIKPHWRGNQELGVISKDYIL